MIVLGAATRFSTESNGPLDRRVAGVRSVTGRLQRRRDGRAAVASHPVTNLFTSVSIIDGLPAFVNS